MESVQSTDSPSSTNAVVGLGIKNYVFQNWANIYSIKPQLYFQPTSIDACIEIVKECNLQGKKLTVFGSGHSPSDLCLSDEWLINLDHLKSVVDFQDHGEYADITVEAGIKIYQLNEYLDKKGYSMQNLGSISDQSVGGIISTGTHGSSPYHGLVSSQYVDLTIINGKGELQFLDGHGDGHGDEETADLFKACLLSLGKMGIIVKATIRTIPQYRIKSKQEVVKFETLLENWDTIWTSSEFIRCWWYPYSRKFVIWRGSKTDEPISGKPRSSWWGSKIGRFIYEALLWCSVKIYPAMTPFVEKFIFNRQFGHVEFFDPHHHDHHSSDSYLSSDDPNSVVQSSIDGLNMDCLFSQFVNEWGCPLTQGPEVLKSLDDAITKASMTHDFFVHVPVEVRCSNTTIPPNHPDYSTRTPLTSGPVYGNLLKPFLDQTPKHLQYAETVTNNQLTLYINATIYRPFSCNAPIYQWFTLFEKILAAAGGKPHWAKNFIGDVSMLPDGVEPKSKYADYEMRGMGTLIEEWYGDDLVQWKNLRKKQDPNGIFLANKDWCLRNGIV